MRLTATRWARATSHFWRVGTGHGRRHVIEQTRKETHGVPLSRLSAIQCVTGFKKRGNGGTVGTANVSGGLSGGTCTPVFFWGNRNSQNSGKIDREGSSSARPKCGAVSALEGVVLRNDTPHIFPL